MYYTIRYRKQSNRKEVKMKLSDVYGKYVASNNLYDKYGIATVTLKRYRNKEGKRIVSLEDAWKLEPTVYVKGSWQKVAKYMEEHINNA